MKKKMLTDTKKIAKNKQTFGLKKNICSQNKNIFKKNKTFALKNNNYLLTKSKNLLHFFFFSNNKTFTL